MIENREELYRKIYQGEETDPAVADLLEQTGERDACYYAGVIRDRIQAKRMAEIALEIREILVREKINKWEYENIKGRIENKIVDTPLVFEV